MKEMFVQLVSFGFSYYKFSNFFANRFFFVNSTAILTDKDLIEDLNANLDKLLPKLMELTADSDKLPYITKRLKEFYLNGSSIIKDFNSQGFVDVS